MRNNLYIIAIGLLLPILSPAQTKFRIAVLGSSTAVGTGADSVKHSWVGLTASHFQLLSLLDTIMDFAVGGSTTRNALPPSIDSTHNNDTIHTITWALRFNPDIVLINFPTNDVVAGFSVREYLLNLRTIYNIAVAAGKKCYIATTQPRDIFDNTKAIVQTRLKEERDSILIEFPGHTFNFYDPLVDPGSMDINPLLSESGGVHPNTAGHWLLYQAVLNANIIPLTGGPLALLYDNFTCRRTAEGIQLQWSAAAMGSMEDFIIQRSGDGAAYEDLSDEKVFHPASVTNYVYTDRLPLPARSFYRLKIEVDGAPGYSTVIPVDAGSKKLGIVRFYAGDGHTGITATLSLPKDEQILLTIFSAAGTPVLQRSYACKAPAATFTVPLPSLSAGVFFMKIATAAGDKIIRSFTVVR
jgi:lysophospholipase L1-like esterase